MENYRGTLSGITHIFIHYISLSNPMVIAAVLVGAVSAGISITMIKVRPLRKYMIFPFILAAATILIGLAGSALNMRETDEAIALERRVGIKPSAPQYYNSECGHNTRLI